MVTLLPITVGFVWRITCTSVRSWMLVRSPTRMEFTSPRTTTFIQTLLSAPRWTSPITWALASTKAVGSTVGRTDRYGRNIRTYYKNSQRPTTDASPTPKSRFGCLIGSWRATDVGNWELSQARQSQSLLLLVLPGLVLVRHFAVLVALEEQDLRDALVGVNLGGKRRRIRDLQRDVAFPLRLEGCDVDDQTAACIRRLADTHRQHVARNAEVLDRLRQRERVRRNDADIGTDIHERSLVEVLGIDDGAVDVGEDLELVSHPDVVAIRRQPVRDDALAYLPVLERLDHPVLE